VQIIEMEGEWEVEGPNVEYVLCEKPLRTHKLNISTKDKLKFANMGYYWNEETIEKITYLLCEYQDVFATTFSKMKGIVGELGEMKNPLKSYVKTVN
jgi:hypothetical protein